MDHTFELKPIKTMEEMEQCREVVTLLRPHLNKDHYIMMVTEMMQQEKYSITAVLDNKKVVAFAGYRAMTSLHSGPIIYLDDLYTLESYRGKGLASLLLKHVRDVALSGNKDAVVLDTDFNNGTAQKLYLKSGFKLAALHLACDLKS